MSSEMDNMLVRLEVRLDNLETHVMRELETIRRHQEAHAKQLAYFDKLTFVGRAFTAVGMAIAGFIGWALSQFPIIKGP